MRFLILLLALIATPLNAQTGASRIKDIVSIENVRSNQLLGYGIVVGLAGTGDRMRNSPQTAEAMTAMLDRLGMNIRDGQLRSQNAAFVMVTASLPAFARSGSAIDVQVSAMGDAASLQGGTLLMTPLRAPDGEIYAIAQGALAVSGFKAQGAAASVSRGVSTSARIAGGALVEREVPFALRSADRLKLALINPDFATAARVAAAINSRWPGMAQMLDPGTVEITAQPGSGGLVDLLPSLSELPVAVDAPARIVINEASGTVVMSADVRVSAVAVAHGGLTITVDETPVASQPAPLSGGDTVVLPRTSVRVDDGSGASLAMLRGASLQQLVGGLNQLGVSPRDLITILQALKTAGALQAEILVQ